MPSGRATKQERRTRRRRGSTTRGTTRSPPAGASWTARARPAPGSGGARGHGAAGDGRHLPGGAAQRGLPGGAQPVPAGSWCPRRVGFFAWYVAYVVTATTAPGLMARPVAGAVNVAMVAGLGQFLTTFLLTWAYARHARLRRDRAALELRWDTQETDARSGTRRCVA